MRCVKRLMLTCAVMLLAAPCFAADDPDAYTILLDRPSRKGEKSPFELVYAQVLTTKTTEQGHDPTTTEDSLGAHFIFDDEVKEVDENGHSKLVVFTVRTCTSVKDKEETVLLPPGTKIIARAKEMDTEFTIDDKPPEKKVDALFKQLISLVRAPDVPTFDKAYGTSTPRKIGETWPIDANATASYLKACGLAVDAKDVSGDVSFKALESSDGEACVRVEGNAHVKHFGDAKHEFDKPDLKLKNATVDSHITWMAPIDPKKNLCSMVSEVTFEYTWKGERQGVSYEVVQTALTERHVRSLKE